MMEDFNLRSGEISMGTTLVAVTYDGGVVLAADSRTSSGTYVVNRVSNKLTRLSEKIYCGRSGSAADTQTIAELASNYLRQKETMDGAPPHVRTAARITQLICFNNRYSLSAGILIAGYDETNGGQVFNIPLGGSLLQQDFAMAGSGSTFLYAWADQNFRRAMNRDQALKFAQEAVAHAISRDGSSGGVIRTVILDRSGVQPHTLPWNKIPYSIESDEKYSSLKRNHSAWESTSLITSANSV